MTRAMRSPGSALKPFIYALAFENGLAHPETLLDDRPSRYGSYQPENFDLAFPGHGHGAQGPAIFAERPGGRIAQRSWGLRDFWPVCSRATCRLPCPRTRRPALPSGLGGLGITLTDLTTALCGPRARRSDARSRAPGGCGAIGSHRSGASPIRSRPGMCSTSCAAPPRPTTRSPDGSLSRRERPTATGTPGRWAMTGISRSAFGSDGPTARRCRGLIGRLVAAPILFDAYGGLNREPEALVAAAFHAAGDDRHFAAAAPACAPRCTQDAGGDDSGAPAHRLPAGRFARRTGAAGRPRDGKPCAEGIRRCAALDVDGRWSARADRQPATGDHMESRRVRVRQAIGHRRARRNGQRGRPRR